MWSSLKIKVIVLFLSISLEINAFPLLESGAARNDGDGSYIRVDDMIISNASYGKAGVIGHNWPNANIPYVFDSSILNEKGLLRSITESQNEISGLTCITFREATTTDTYSIRYRISPYEADCSSHVGFQNILNQDINLNVGCVKGAIIHETLHALGFLHEQTRNDRDSYVKIRYENLISSNFIHNFARDDKLGYETDYFGVPYNYESIMHYPPYAFSVNTSDPEKNTIEAIPQSESSDAIGDPSLMGKLLTLTPGDVEMINRKYNCPKNAESPVPVATTEPYPIEGTDGSEDGDLVTTGTTEERKTTETDVTEVYVTEETSVISETTTEPYTTEGDHSDSEVTSQSEDVETESPVPISDVEETPEPVTVPTTSTEQSPIEGIGGGGEVEGFVTGATEEGQTAETDVTEVYVTITEETSVISETTTEPSPIEEDHLDQGVISESEDVETEGPAPISDAEETPEPVPISDVEETPEPVTVPTTTTEQPPIEGIGGGGDVGGFVTGATEEGQTTETDVTEVCVTFTEETSVISETTTDPSPIEEDHLDQGVISDSESENVETESPVPISDTEETPEPVTVPTTTTTEQPPIEGIGGGGEDGGFVTGATEEVQTAETDVTEVYVTITEETSVISESTTEPSPIEGDHTEYGVTSESEDVETESTTIVDTVTATEIVTDNTVTPTTQKTTEVTQSQSSTTTTTTAKTTTTASTTPRPTSTPLVSSTLTTVLTTSTSTSTPTAKLPVTPTPFTTTTEIFPCSILSIKPIIC